jgi:hypothetical protein
MGHMTERAITACVFLISMCGAALAQPSQPAMPNWDPRAYCERSQRMIAMESATMLRACIDQEERAEAMVENMQPKEEPEEEEPEEGAPMTPEAEAEAKHWRRVCNKALREGKPMPADFVCEHIPAEMAAQIAEALKAATDGDGIKRAFEQQEAIPLPAEWPVPADLVLELKRANDLLEAVSQ